MRVLPHVSSTKTCQKNLDVLSLPCSFYLIDWHNLLSIIFILSIPASLRLTCVVKLATSGQTIVHGILVFIYSFCIIRIYQSWELLSDQHTFDQCHFNLSNRFTDQDSLTYCIALRKRIVFNLQFVNMSISTNMCFVVYYMCSCKLLQAQ